MIEIKYDFEGFLSNFIDNVDLPDSPEKSLAYNLREVIQLKKITDKIVAVDFQYSEHNGKRGVIVSLATSGQTVGEFTQILTPKQPFTKDIVDNSKSVVACLLDSYNRHYTDMLVKNSITLSRSGRYWTGFAIILSLFLFVVSVSVSIGAIG